jgi:hypothetical protein
MFNNTPTRTAPFLRIRISIRCMFSWFGILLSLLLCSCATRTSRQLPADVNINQDAGRGSLVFVTLQLASGEDLPFVVDTGSPGTLFDKSLVPKLGCRMPLGTWTVPIGGEKQKSGVYWEPKLYLGNTRLKTGRLCAAVDFQGISKQLGRPVMGILAMDCLRHYCVQLDFQAGKMRFLDPKSLHANSHGRPLPLRFSLYSQLFTDHPGITGGKASRLLVDTGWNGDGLVSREPTNGLVSEGWVHLPECVWNDQTYTDLNLRTGGEVLGLGFLARHLVTFDFPRRVMYLQQTCSGPLLNEELRAAMEFLRDLKRKGQAPGWLPNDKGKLSAETHPDPETFGFAAGKEGDSMVCHYLIARNSKESPWRLKRAWRTDQNGKVIEEFSVP